MIRIAIGLLMVLGSVGTQDFYDECLMAADCVAGEPPSMWMTTGLSVLGLFMMYWGVWSNRDDFFRDDDDGIW